MAKCPTALDALLEVSPSSAEVSSLHMHISTVQVQSSYLDGLGTTKQRECLIEL